jgi:arabinoxylan arabinofuranohydrolase
MIHLPRTKTLLKFKIVSICLLISMASFAQKKNSNTKIYPYGNPVIKHMYTADASPHVMPDGRVWMVTSVDHEDGGGYSTMHCYHTFSSKDMVNWTDHGEVLNIYDVIGKTEEPKGEDWALWAPDMVYYEGKYYLYFPVRILYKEGGYDEKNRKTIAYTGVAVSDSPDKRFKVINPKIEETTGIDPAIFIDDDGQKYLYYGSHMAAKLKDNMTELDGKPIKLDVDDDRFMEAIWMNKKAGKYYLSYHTEYDKPINPENPDDLSRKKSRLDYGVSDNPLGPFEYKGILNYELGVNVNEGPKYPGKNYVPWRLYQSNHGGIVEYHGQEYLFYHTAALSSWRQDEFKNAGTWTQRSVCIDKIDYDESGQIRPVQQTLTGVPPVVINQPFEINLDIKSNVIKNNILEFKDINLGTGYYYAGMNIKGINTPAKCAIHLDKPDGELIGTFMIKKDGISETLLRNANGKHNIYFVFENQFDTKSTIVSVKIFAGSPK